MASSVYSEVTSVSTYGFERDRVLDKLKTASTTLPYTVDDITISHNDFAVSDVYNNSIRKLYRIICILLLMQSFLQIHHLLHLPQTLYLLMMLWLGSWLG